MKHLKEFIKIIIAIFAVLFISSYYVIKIYIEDAGNFKAEAKLFNKSKFWIYREHCKIIFAALFCLVLNIASILITLHYFNIINYLNF